MAHVDWLHLIQVVSIFSAGLYAFLAFTSWKIILDTGEMFFWRAITAMFAVFALLAQVLG